MEEEEQQNHDVFRDCLFAVVIAKLAPAASSYPQKSLQKKRKSETDTAAKTASSQAVKDESSDPTELAEFAEYLSSEGFPALPPELRSLSHRSVRDSHALSDTYSLPLSLTTIERLVEYLPCSVPDTLLAYGLINPPSSDLQSFMTPVFAAYVATVTTPPPKWIDTRTSACEICDRDWVPMTYHHLIPKQVHPKVLKRGWHEEHQLNSVAWLCRACHSFVHRMASNEELAREWYTVDRICDRDDVQKWAQWVRRVRWKKS